jgi:SAM-dependent methyltransferase
MASFDIVLCTEVFEHVEKWPLILDTIHEALVPGGAAFVTFASEGRRPHGARGEHDVPAGEWYANVSRAEFRQALLRGPAWADFGVAYNPNPGDIYAWFKKGR